jgi:formylglycine-generating enzyme required for sulfatase activity
VVVDTDLAVPKMVARLRVDFFTPSGTWYATRDLALPRKVDWPVSFAVALDEGQGPADVVIRLRAYPEGKVRDYLGERHETRPETCDSAACAGNNPAACCPLVIPPPVASTSGPLLREASRTPVSEPLPALTVDRLVVVHVEPGIVGKAVVVLHAGCIGTMSDVHDFANLATCVDQENETVPPTKPSIEANLTLPSTLVGTFEQPFAAGCAAKPRPGSMSGNVPLHDEDACVPGGIFVLGGIDSSDGSENSSLPERAAIIRSFLMDRYEVTVGRYRKALADGYIPYEKLQTGFPACTWSDMPSGREEEPLDCITVENARAFCKAQGGDLPTEAQWEYAATSAGRSAKTHFPWGNGDGSYPSCDDVVYGRALGFACGSKPSHAANVFESDHAGGDVTRDEGGHIVDLGGNVAEYVSDSFAQYASNCWLAAPLLEPSCTAVGDVAATRGAQYGRVGYYNLLSTLRSTAPRSSYAAETGFRCVRPGNP